MYMTNLFAFCATDPNTMLSAQEPIGDGNDAALKETAEQVKTIILCPGNNGAHKGRFNETLQNLNKYKAKMHYLKLNKTDIPAHPLYLNGGFRPKRYKFPCPARCSP